MLLSAQQVADSGGDEKAGKADSATFLQLEDVVEGILRSRYRPLRARYRQYFLERKQQQQHVLTEAAAAAAPSPGSTGAEGDVESLMAVPAQRERSQVSSSKLTVAEPDSSLHTNCIPCSCPSATLSSLHTVHGRRSRWAGQLDGSSLLLWWQHSALRRASIPSSVILPVKAVQRRHERQPRLCVQERLRWIWSSNVSKDRCCLSEQSKRRGPSSAVGGQTRQAQGCGCRISLRISSVVSSETTSWSPFWNYAWPLDLSEHWDKTSLDSFLPCRFLMHMKIGNSSTWTMRPVPSTMASSGQGSEGA